MVTMSDTDIELQKYGELVIIRPPGTTEDIIETLSHVKSHGDLKAFEKLESIIDKEKTARQDLSDIFKKIVLFEAATYIAGIYSTELPDTDQAKILVPKILSSQTLLLHDSFGDYVDSYVLIGDSYKSLVEERGVLTVGGKVEGSYLNDLAEVLDLCEPMKLQESMHARFAGRSIDFVIYGQSTEYGEEIDSNPDFAEFAKKWSHLFNPVVGYIEVKSPETVDYIEGMMKELKQDHITLDDSKVRFNNGRSVCDQLKIAKKYWNY